MVDMTGSRRVSDESARAGEEATVLKVLMERMPIPMSVDIPDGWVVWCAEDVPEDIALVAQRVGDHGESLATITMDGQLWSADASLDDLAEELVAQAAEAYVSVELLSREHGGEPEVPTLKQAVAARVEQGASSAELVQDQTLIGVIDQLDQSKRVVLRMALTVAPELRDRIAPEFWSIIATLDPGDGRATI